MKWSRAFIPTLRATPKDAEAVSHALLLRGGYVRQLGAGTYAYLPLGVRVLAKAAQIVREEMNRVGALECLLPALHPAELWNATGRLATMKDVLFRLKDRHGRDVVLGPTHEEVITELVRGELQSYKQLPLMLYQIQTKFRDELRPKSGIIRSKEFLMKDAYSFHTSTTSLDESYRAMYAAYEAIFARCRLTTIPCQADSGAMGGDVSHEFMAPSAGGEDWIVRCPCGYAASLPVAEGYVDPLVRGASAPPTSGEQPHEVQTPGLTTVVDVSRYLHVAPSDLIKTILYTTPQRDQVFGVVVRGDHAVNEAAVARVVRAETLMLADAESIERATGGPKGFTGPVGVSSNVQLIVDHAVMAMRECIAGANKANTHLQHVVPARDFSPHQMAWVRHVITGDACPSCRQPLTLERALELGHVFKLGTKYSASLGLIVQNESGERVPPIMGCYGIGVNRIVATAAEQHHDAQGVIWPQTLSPFDVLLIVLDVSDAPSRALGDQLYQQFTTHGMAVLYDDRELSAGAKFHDADLTGVPLRLVVGKRSVQAGQVELNFRKTKKKEMLPSSEACEHLKKLLDNPTLFELQ